MPDKDIPTGPTGAPYGQNEGGSPLPPFPLDNPPMIVNPVPITDPEALAAQSTDSEWQQDFIKDGPKRAKDRAAAYAANPASVNYKSPEAEVVAPEPNPANTFGGSDTELPKDATYEKKRRASTKPEAVKAASGDEDEDPKREAPKVTSGQATTKRTS
jgi:hypothetical protein